ncbi:hypothetical protein GWK47_041015 [Chionoecetes opilio]|uniref:Uncharacterized protein n=1 Tax=Chionoecetes opilio TaxID=41210 RepID=A0A8J5CXE1_CHIOP|nr:hypothetical protein GWK47_041015 [Chionoecetes opilio]
MHKSSKLSLVLAKRGVFPALCEAALTWQREDAWMCIKALLGRQQLIRDFLHHHSDPTHLAAPRRNLKLQPCLTRTPDTRDTSTTVMELADITAPDYSRFLKMDASYASPQLASYRACPGKLCSDTEEVLISQTTVLERGHHLGVKTDLTHHLLQERNVSSLCSETLLQIILGMLNTHLGGKIYIGLNQFGVVQGVKMTRDQQDCFLLGTEQVTGAFVLQII